MTKADETWVTIPEEEQVRIQKKSDFYSKFLLTLVICTKCLMSSNQ